MNILNLIESQIQTKSSVVKTNNLPRRLMQNMYPFDERKLGAGVDYVVLKTKDPHTVRKISHTSNIFDDAYYIYISYIIEHKLQDNPHFPRIYNVKRIEDNEKKRSHYSFELEKLESIDSISTEELKLWIENNIKREYFNSVQMHTHEEIETFISQIIKSCIQSKQLSMDSITDKRLIQACNIINDIKHKNNELYYDIHSENLMFRRAPFGLQLVITDPFA